VKSSFKQAITIALLAIAIIAVPSGNTAIASKSNCSLVRNIYPFGIALNKPSIGTSRAEVNRKKYIQFKYLDNDLDGIVCEIERLQTTVTFPVTSPVTVPSTIVTVPSSTFITQPRTFITQPRTFITQPRTAITIPTTTINPGCIGLSWLDCRLFIGNQNRNTIPQNLITTSTITVPPVSTTTLPPTTTTTALPTTTTTICVPDSYEVSRLNFAIQPWNNNYSRTRALFIYENRTDAVRMLDSYTQAMRDRYDSAMRSINSCVRVYWEITNWNSITWPNR
jgi:hypothetical protein